MTTSNDANPQRLAKPEQLTTLTQDQLVTAILRLTMEVSVLRDRLHTHETMLSANGLLTTEAVDQFEPDTANKATRAAARQQLIAQILGDLQR
ncbi:MAG: hypothetical protein AAF290_12800 [Pseudomonadota bacterium]